MTTDRALTFSTRILGFMVQPLSTLWLIAAVLAVSTVVASLIGDAFYWEGLFGIATVMGVTRLVASVTGVRPWPWSPPMTSLPHDTESAGADRQ